MLHMEINCGLLAGFLLVAVVANGQGLGSPRRDTALPGEYTAIAGNGSNASVTLPQTPDAATPVQCFVNGVPRRQGTDFQVNGQVLTFVAASTPRSGDSVTVFYKYTPSGARGVGIQPLPSTPLLQTDSGAKAMHDNVALLLAQTAPITWAPLSARSVPADAAPAMSSGVQSRAVASLKQRLSRTGSVSTDSSRAVRSSAGSPGAPNAPGREPSDEPASVRGLKALIQKQQTGVRQ
jgi:hypothetical protein